MNRIRKWKDTNVLILNMYHLILGLILGYGIARNSVLAMTIGVALYFIMFFPFDFWTPEKD